MVGLLAWAADVVGGNANANGNGNGVQYIVLPKFSGQEEKYLRELDQKVTSLQRTLQLLRQRIPQTLPHLHTHTSASNSSLTLELCAHSATRLNAEQRVNIKFVLTTHHLQAVKKNHEAHRKC
jgi:hypothetical protein